MTRVDFYVLADEDPRKFACRLAEKTYKLGHRLYIQVDSRQDAEHLDDLLWTFRQGSFIPHAIDQDAAGSDVPVLIGCANGPHDERELLINLSTAVPDFFNRFARVAEIIAADEASKRTGRERFRFYKGENYTPTSHNISQ